MRVIVTNSYDEMSTEAAKIVAGQIYLKPDSVLGLATGSTPLSMYKKLIAVHEMIGLDFSQVTTFNLDEYIGMAPRQSPELSLLHASQFLRFHQHKAGKYLYPRRHGQRYRSRRQAL